MIWLDVLIFAAVAVFLGLRLRAVLGERSPDDPTPPTYAPPPTAAEPIARQQMEDIPAPVGRPSVLQEAPDSLAGRLALIGQSDPNFNEKGFLQGARAAFEAIVTSFAKADTTTLRPLVSDDVYDSFSAALRAREAAKETLETRILKIKEAEVVEASMKINIARVTVRFVSEQVQTLKDASGAIIDGHPTQSKEVTDRWTFERNTRSLDPNWHLAETAAAG